jgi:hypothetical protein
MFGLGRIFKAISYFFKGIIRGRAEKMAENEHVQAAIYDETIDKQDDRFNAKLDTVAALTVSIMTKEKELVKLEAEIASVEKSKLGAFKEMERIKNTLQLAGKSNAEIVADQQMVKLITLHSAATTQLETKRARQTTVTAELEKKRKEKAIQVGTLSQISAKKKALLEEKTSAIAALQDAKMKEEEAKIAAGHDKDTSDESLEVARRARLNAEARASVASEAAGADFDTSMAELAQMGEKNANDAALLSMLGLGDEAAVKLDEAKLPEN